MCPKSKSMLKFPALRSAGLTSHKPGGTEALFAFVSTWLSCMCLYATCFTNIPT